MVHALVDGDVHLLKENTVSGDQVALLDVDDIADDQMSDRNGGASSVASSIHDNSLIIDFVPQFEELSLFDVIARGRNDRRKQQSAVNGQRLHIRVPVAAERGDDKVKGCSPHQEDDVGVFKLSGQKGEERLNLRHGDEMSPKYFLPSLKINFVTDDAALPVSIEQLTEAQIISTVFEDIKAEPALALVVGQPHILLVEKERKILLADSKDVLVFQNLLFFVFS